MHVTASYPTCGTCVVVRRYLAMMEGWTIPFKPLIWIWTMMKGWTLWDELGIWVSCISYIIFANLWWNDDFVENDDFEINFLKLYIWCFKIILGVWVWWSTSSTLNEITPDILTRQSHCLTLYFDMCSGWRLKMNNRKLGCLEDHGLCGCLNCCCVIELRQPRLF